MNLPVSLSVYTMTPQPSWQPGADQAADLVQIMPSSSHCQGTSPPVYMTGGSLKNVGRIPFDSSLSWGMSILIVI